MSQSPNFAGMAGIVAVPLRFAPGGPCAAERERSKEIPIGEFFRPGFSLRDLIAEIITFVVEILALLR
jgi:hypothetical protein